MRRMSREVPYNSGKNVKLSFQVHLLGKITYFVDKLCKVSSEGCPILFNLLPVLKASREGMVRALQRCALYIGTAASRRKVLVIPPYACLPFSSFHITGEAATLLK